MSDPVLHHMPEYTCSHGYARTHDDPCETCDDRDELWAGFDNTPTDSQDTPTDALSSLRAALVDTAGLDDIPDPEPLIEGILYLDTINWIIGPPGNGKSFVALDIAGSVAAGTNWQTYPVHSGPVLYLVAEGVRGIKQRVRAWEAANRLKMTDVYFLPVPVQASNATQWDALVTLAAELRPALVIVDTQARVTVGMEENSAKEMGVFVDRVEALRKKTGACIGIVHHTGRNGENGRGSSSLDGALSTIMKIAKDGDNITVECIKQKDAPEFDKINLRLVSYDSSAILTPNDLGGTVHSGTISNPKTIKAWWDAFGSQPVSGSQLIKEKIFSSSTFYRNVNELVKQGIVLKEGTERRPLFSLKDIHDN